jgi:transposase
LLWEEYRQANPDGYHYSRFCDLYQRWRRKQISCCGRSIRPVKSCSGKGE